MTTKAVIAKYIIVDDAGNDTSVAVESRGEDSWAVTRTGRCLSANGIWDWEPLPSSRTPEWLDSHRFDRQTALKLALAAGALQVERSA